MRFETKINKILEVESKRLTIKDGKIVKEISPFAKSLTLYDFIKEYKIENKILIFKYLDKEYNKIKTKKIMLPKINMFNYFSKYLKSLKEEIKRENKILKKEYK